MTALWLACIGLCLAGAVCLLRRPRRTVYEVPMEWQEQEYRRTTIQADFVAPIEQENRE